MSITTKTYTFLGKILNLNNMQGSFYIIPSTYYDKNFRSSAKHSLNI